MTNDGPTRVLHLCAGNLYGGVERIVSECASDRHLCPEMSPSFAVCFDGRLSEEIDASGAECTRLGPARLSRPWTIVRARRRLAALLACMNAPSSVVVCHSSWIYALAAPVVRRARRPAPALAAQHGVGARLGRTVGAANPARRNHRQQQVHRRECRRPFCRGAARRGVHACGHGRLGADREALRASMGVNPLTPVILAASRFEACKGHRALIAAVAQIPEPWQLWVAGKAQRSIEDAYERDLRHLVKALGLEQRVRFLGERRDVAAWMRAADILCQPNTTPGIFRPDVRRGSVCRHPGRDHGGWWCTGNSDRSVRRAGAAGRRSRTGLRTSSISSPTATCVWLGAAGPARARELCDPRRQLRALAAVVSTSGNSRVPA